MRKALAMLALAPVLVAQGLAVRRRALRLPEATGPRAGSAGSGRRYGLLVVGDSAAAGVGAATQDEALVGQLRDRLADRYRVDWRLVATTGHTAGEALRALAAVEDFRIDGAVTSVGVNDVIARTPIPRFRRTLGDLVEALRRRGARDIVLSGVPPMGRFPLLPQPLRAVLGNRADEFDAVLAEVARVRGATHLPMRFADGLGPEHMAEDGFHPGPAVYRAWAAAAHDALLRPAAASVRVAGDSR